VQTRVLVLTVMLVLTLAWATVKADAATWTTQPTSTPAGPAGSQLTGVSCTSAAWCMAVGTTDGGYPQPPGRAGPFGTFAETWDGSRWTLTPTAAAAGTDPGLFAVSCASPSFCVAVGYTNSTGPTLEPDGYVSQASRALVELWNGAAWTVQSNPGAALTESGLFGVSCISTTACIAVGSHKSGKYGNAVLTEVWNGTAWRVTPTPRAAKYGSSLQAVSCIAADACTAVGTYNANRHVGVTEPLPLAERWDGRRWALQHPPPELERYRGKVYANNTLLTGVSCLSRTFCMASGVTQRAQNGDAWGAYAVRWKGARWLRATAGLPRHGPLWGVACLSSLDCVATGQFENGVFPAPATTQPLAEGWNGARWDRIVLPRVPTPPGDPTPDFFDDSDPALLAISCLAQFGCTAVGAQASGNGNDAATLAQSNLATPTPPPPPVFAQSVDAAVVGGGVNVKAPGSSFFAPLERPEQLQLGATIDTRAGRVRITIVDAAGKSFTADFYGGVFKITQLAAAGGLTQLALVGGRFGACTRASRAASAARKRRPTKSVRHLWASGSGPFRTDGRFAAGTAIGTTWETDDRCDGTLVKVSQGAVSVLDLVRRKAVVVRARHQYLARAR
jgi:hypothetical protein